MYVSKTNVVVPRTNLIFRILSWHLPIRISI